MAGAPVLVLAATRVELRYLLDQLRAAPPEGVPVAASRASWGDLPLVLARCGVGKANAASPRATCSRARPTGAFSTWGAPGPSLRARDVFGGWRPLAESLGGAAVAVAALGARVPCLEVRGISNLAGDRDRASWDIPLASDRAGQVAGKLLDRWSRVEKPLAGAGGRP